MYPAMKQSAGDKPPLMQYWDDIRAKERGKLARNHPFGVGQVKEDWDLPCILLLYTYDMY
jgi:hypothetical protein